MATQYEIELQKQLERSRHNPVDEYSAGLLDLARFNAQQRFIQQENATRLEGQKEILTQTQVAEAEENKKRFKQQKELQTTLLKSQAEIQEARDKAEALRQEARDLKLDERQRTTLHEQADEWDKRIAAQEKRQQEFIEAGYKKAELAAQTAIEVADKRAQAAERSRVKDKFGELGFVQEEGESDEKYIARSQKQYKSDLAAQLTNTYNVIEGTRKQIQDLTSKSISDYPRRLAEEAWKSTRGLIPEPQQGILDKMDPVKRAAQIAGLPDKYKSAKLQFSQGLKDAREIIPEVDAKTQSLVDGKGGLRVQLGELEKVHALRLNSKDYAPAIDEYLKRIGAPGAPPPGTGLVPPPAAGTGQQFDYMGNPVASAANPASGLAFGKAATTSPASALTPGVGTGAGAPLNPVSPAAAATVSTNAAVDPAVQARIQARKDEAVLLGTTPDELYSPALQTSARVSRALVDNPTLSLSGLPSLVPVGPPARGLPPTPGEIAAFRAGIGRPAASPAPGIMDRIAMGVRDAAPSAFAPAIPPTAPAPIAGRMPGPATYNEAVGVPLELGPSPAAFPPTAMFPVGGLGRAPAVAPGVMDARALRGARVRQAIRLKYPDLELNLNLDRVPVEDLERLYMEREAQRMGPPLITPVEPTAPLELRF
jgi:hypothetical protein